MKKKQLLQSSKILLSLMLMISMLFIHHPIQAEDHIIKIACVGDSLTDGYLSSSGNKSNTAYPAQLQQMLGEGYEVGNYGKTSYTLMKDTDKSYWNSTEFNNSKNFLPNYVIIMLGTNDSKPAYWNEETYKKDAIDLYQTYANLSSKPHVIFALSPQSYATTTQITNTSVNTLHEAQLELVQEQGWDYIDMYAYTTNRQDLYHSDMIHFTDAGYRYIAQCMYEKITGKKLGYTYVPHTQTSGEHYFTFASGKWENGNSAHTWSKAIDGNKPRDTWYEVHFQGNKIDIYAGNNSMMGEVEYFIDGQSMGVFDLYHPTNINSEFITTISGLDDEPHVLRVEATGNRNASGSGDIRIDAAQVLIYENNEYILSLINDLLNRVEQLNPNVYTIESFMEVVNAQANVEVLIQEEDVTKEELYEAKDALEKAVEQLVGKPPLPQQVQNLVVEDTNYKSITLTWEESINATSYDIYRKGYKEDAVFEYVDTVSKPTYVESGVMTGKTYSFYVVAKNENGVARESEVVNMATTLKGNVRLAMEQVGTSRFFLTWNKVDGATRYIVYRKRNDDKMKKVLTLGKDDISYTTAELPHGDYEFQVRAGRYDSVNRVMTGASNKVSGTVEAIKPTVTVTAGTKSAKISWKKMKGVTHYQVYRATSSTGKYTKLTTTKELSYTAKSLTSGKKYYFKVRGYKTYKSGTDIKYSVYTPESSVKAVTAK